MPITVVGVGADRPSSNSRTPGKILEKNDVVARCKWLIILAETLPESSFVFFKSRLFEHWGAVEKGLTTQRHEGGPKGIGFHYRGTKSRRRPISTRCRTPPSGRTGPKMGHAGFSFTQFDLCAVCSRVRLFHCAMLFCSRHLSLFTPKMRSQNWSGISPRADAAAI